MRIIQEEAKNLREEYDRAQEAQQEADSKLFEIQLKSKQAQQKYEQQIKQTKDKLEEVGFNILTMFLIMLKDGSRI